MKLRTIGNCTRLVTFLLLLAASSNSGRAQEQASLDSAALDAAPRRPLPAERPVYRPATLAVRPKANLKLFLPLVAGTYVAAGLDMHRTMAIRQHDPSFQETDPLARPFTRLPPPAYYAVGFAMVTGLDWVSLRMARSERWHRIWWLPQVCAIGGNLFGYTYSMRSE